MEVVRSEGASIPVNIYGVLKEIGLPKRHFRKPIRSKISEEEGRGCTSASPARLRGRYKVPLIRMGARPKRSPRARHNVKVLLPIRERKNDDRFERNLRGRNEMVEVSGCGCWMFSKLS